MVSNGEFFHLRAFISQRNYWFRGWGNLRILIIISKRPLKVDIMKIGTFQKSPPMWGGEHFESTKMTNVTHFFGKPSLNFFKIFFQILLFYEKNHYEFIFRILKFPKTRPQWRFLERVFSPKTEIRIFSLFIIRFG